MRLIPRREAEETFRLEPTMGSAPPFGFPAEGVRKAGVYDVNRGEIAREHEARERKAAIKRGILSFFRTAFALLFCAGLAWLGRAAWEEAQTSPYFRLTHFTFEGDAAKVPLERVRGALEELIEGNFFTVDLDAVREAVEGLPWVRSASVRRLWPDGLAIKAEVYDAMALYEDGRLVSTRGELFSANPEENPEGGNLPSFYGPSVQVENLARAYPHFEEAARALSARVTDINCSDRGSWSFVMEGDWMPSTKVEFGIEEQMEKLAAKAASLAAAYPLIVKVMQGPPSKIDARYERAFAASQPDHLAFRLHLDAVAAGRRGEEASPEAASNADPGEEGGDGEDGGDGEKANP